MPEQKTYPIGAKRLKQEQPGLIRRFTARLHSLHASLAVAIKGVDDSGERARQASLLLQRLAFLSSLQHRGLFANDSRYLQQRLAHQIGNHEFYRDVLCSLFEGRSPECPLSLASLFIESAHDQPSQAMALPNNIFAPIFALFDEYFWPLDHPASGEESAIGPEVLDALFARDTAQKELGAYYTPADITAYITRNTVLPALFARAREECQEVESELWQLFVQQPQRYLFAAARQGCELPLPPEIAAGLHDVSQRHSWQEAGAPPYALPGETWREVVARRTHLSEVAVQLEQPNPDGLKRLITWNVDQPLLILDMLNNCQQPGVLVACYQNLRRLTILDPTCGCGAFLYAALAQLEPLYLASLTRMEELLATLPASHFTASQRALMQNWLAEAGCGEMRAGRIARWIVARNLYGVDLMPEAVERCRQRLFLKILAACSDQPGRELAADFGQHIRVGNSLVGSLDESQSASQQAFHWPLEFPEAMQRGGFDVVIGNPPYVEYKQVQQSYTVDGYTTLETGNLYALTMERSLHLLAPGGRFGMIVPASATCTDGYRSLQQHLLAQQELHIASFSDQRGRLFDIPHPRLCIISYERARPNASQPCRVFTTPYVKLEHARRATLFEHLLYTEVTRQVKPGLIPRYGSPLERAIQGKLTQQQHNVGEFVQRHGAYPIYFTRKLSWFVQVMPFIPLILDERGERRAPSELKTLRFGSRNEAQMAFGALNSNLFYWLITTGSDCRNLNAREVLGLPLDLASINPILQQKLCLLANELAEDLLAHAEMKPMVFQGQGRLTIQCLRPAYSKPIIDEIDRLLAGHYGLSAEELDFLLHYDAKYRLPGHTRETALV